MNEPDNDDAMLRRLRSCRLAEPSPDLRDRVLAAARLAFPRPEAACDEVPWTTALRPVWLAAAALVLLVAGNAVLQARLPPPVDLSPLFEDGAGAPVSSARQRRIVAMILLDAGGLEGRDPAGDGRPWCQGENGQEPDHRPASLGPPPNREGVRR